MLDWHIDCFPCSVCGNILESDSHLRLLSTGSLICKIHTYSCSVCNNVIEDPAILTEDQAFCATCFICRFCGKKIENLKYGRTSQGIFCTDCYDFLSERRRRKALANTINLEETMEMLEARRTALTAKVLQQVKSRKKSRTKQAESTRASGHGD